MLRDFSWFQPAPRNLTVDKRRLRIWRRWGGVYQKSPEFRLLKRIEFERQRLSQGAANEVGSVYWLLPFRHKFRRIFDRFHTLPHQGEVDVIRYYLAYCPPEMIPISIWLIGRCANCLRLYGISEFCHDPSPQVRRRVAKALRRLEAWSLLEEMARAYPNDRQIQQFASAPATPRPFNERLSHYVETVDDSHADEVLTPSRMPFWSLEKSWNYTPPKSVLMIRRMLRRIRHWVRWGVS